jgi:hypothetical protein
LFGRASAQLTTTVEPARKFTRANDFMGLAALLRNFFRPQLQVAGILSDAERPHHGPFRSGKTCENETNLSPSEMKRFAAQVLTR